MADYYDTLGSILRDRLNDDTDPFLEAIEKRNVKYHSEPPKPNPQPELVPVRVPVPPSLVEDFAVLQVPAGIPLAYCKKSWKRLLKKYHPDFIEDTQAQTEAAAVIRRLNRSYKRIESWFLTGKDPDKK